MRRKFTPEEFAAAFWSKVDRTENGCWLWNGSRNPLGYGMVRVASRRPGPIGAHRIAYELMHGPIPDELWVLHHCDNPPCVNAEAHLFLGTEADNARDKVAKGRHKSGRVSGERHGRSKLSRTVVDAIRARYASGATTMDALGQEYSVRTSTIWNIVNGRTWRDE